MSDDEKKKLEFDFYVRVSVQYSTLFVALVFGTFSILNILSSKPPNQIAWMPLASTYVMFYMGGIFLIFKLWDCVNRSHNLMSKLGLGRPKFSNIFENRIVWIIISIFWVLISPTELILVYLLALT